MWRSGSSDGLPNPPRREGGRNARRPSASDQLDAGHRGVVALARAELEDPGVAARTVGVAGADVVEQLVGHLEVTQEGQHLAVVVQAALAGLGDELLGDGAHGLGLGLGGDDAFGGDQRGDQVGHHQPSGAGREPPKRRALLGTFLAW